MGIIRPPLGKGLDMINSQLRLPVAVQTAAFLPFMQHTNVGHDRIAADVAFPSLTARIFDRAIIGLQLCQNFPDLLGVVLTPPARSFARLLRPLAGCLSFCSLAVGISIGWIALTFGMAANLRQMLTFHAPVRAYPPGGDVPLRARHSREISGQSLCNRFGAGNQLHIWMISKMFSEYNYTVA